MVVTTPLRPVTKIIFSLLYSLKSQNSLRSDSWLFKLFLAAGKKLFFYVTGLTLRCHHHSCPVAKLLWCYLAVGNAITLRSRSNAPLMANRPVQPRSAYRLFGEKGEVLDKSSFSWRRGVGLLIGALGLLR